MSIGVAATHGYGEMVTEKWLRRDCYGEMVTEKWLRRDGYGEMVTEKWLRSFTASTGFRVTVSQFYGFMVLQFASEPPGLHCNKKCAEVH